MLYAHFYMYKMKVEELNSDSGSIDKPMPFRDINKKGDDDFVYF